MKDKIENKEGLNVVLKHKGVSENSRIFCDKIEYLHERGNREYLKGDCMPFFDHHLMFYNKKDLIFKVWLPNGDKDKEFKDIYEAIKSVGIKVFDKIDQ